MKSGRRIGILGAAALLIILAALPASSAAQTAPASKSLTVERIFSEPNLSGELTRGLVWSPDSKQLGYFATSGSGKDAKTELWVMDAATDARRLLISADKLELMLPPPPVHATQATGAARRPPSQYQWAPDGEALLFIGDTSLTWFDLKTQKPRTLVSGKDAIADSKISPDGRWVSFVRDHNLWLVDVANAALRPLTKGGTEDVREGELDWVYPEELQLDSAYWWSPDSSAIAYLEMDERPVTKYPIRDSLTDPTEIDWERYPQAGSANPIVHVYVTPVAGGESRLMDTGKDTDIYIPRVNWLPDSKQLAIQRLNRAQTVLELLIADIGTGRTRTALTEKDAYWINVRDDLHFFHDGRRFLWSSERSGYRHLYLYNVDGTQIAQLTHGDWEVSRVVSVDEARSLVYFTATKKTPLERQLYRVALDGSGLMQITQQAGTHMVNFAPDSGAFVDMFSNATTPPRQDLVRADGTEIAAINENKVDELASYPVSPVEFLTVKAHDGVSLNAMMIKPVGFDATRKYPVIVYTYGGPSAQVVVNAWQGFVYLWHEMLAEKGFLIFAVDNRGSTGRGHVFEEPIHNHLGALELSDQRDGVAYLRTLPYVDGSRIGIWGISYGGYMTLNAMFETSDDFKAGFAGSPVTDWRLYDTIYTERYMGLPQTHAAEYKASSPVTTAPELRGKLLVSVGTGDDNVHFENTLEMLNELIDAQKYAEVAIFPGRGHGISDPDGRIVLFRRVTDFFMQNLQ